MTSNITPNVVAKHGKINIVFRQASPAVVDIWIIQNYTAEKLHKELLENQRYGTDMLTSQGVNFRIENFEDNEIILHVEYSTAFRRAYLLTEEGRDTLIEGLENAY